MTSRKCVNDPNVFCYTCGEFTVKENRRTIDDFYKKAYYAYFKVKLGDQDKPWAPHVVCLSCKEHLRQWTNGDRTSLGFSIPMIWREPLNHHDDCYFCLVPNVRGFNKKNHKSIKYPSLPSAIRPVPHANLPVPIFNGFLDDSDEDPQYGPVSDDTSQDEIDKIDVEFDELNSEPKQFDQYELSDLIRDLNLAKDSAELLAFRLKKKNLLARDMDLYDSPDQPGNLKWFPWLVLGAQILGLASVILVAVWLGHYRGGFAWQSDIAREFNYHPLFMVLGLIFLYGDAILVYRVFRNGHKTYIKILHAVMMLLSLIFSSVGLKAVFDSHNLADKPIPNMYSLHSWIGLTTVLLFALQWIFGFCSYLMPNVSHQWKQNLMPYHAFFGMVIFCMALASSLTGLTEKAFFVLKFNYATSQEGILINSLGLVLISFVVSIIYIATRPEYKRYPLPEERHIQLSE